MSSGLRRLDPRRALVIGGSLGGLFAAHLLRAKGWSVTVFERASTDLTGRGAGIGTRHELFSVMSRIGLQPDPSIGVGVHSHFGLNKNGSIICEVSCRSILSSWARVYKPLRDALPANLYHAGVELERIEQDSSSATAFFVDGTRANGELIVAADGLHSTVRKQYLPKATPCYAGYVSWRGVVEEQAVPPELRSVIFNNMLFFLPPTGLLLCTPMASKDGDNVHCCQFIWFRPVAESALADLCTGTDGIQYAVAIPPPLIRVEHLNELRADAQRDLPQPIARLVDRAAQIRLAPIFDLVSPRLAFGRVALLGDAASVARPHVATGVTKAALDAQCLVDTLSATNGIQAALIRYEHDRRIFAQWLVERGRHIGLRLFPTPAVHKATKPALSDLHTLMREYGPMGIIGDPTANPTDWTRCRIT
jgi:2-polyprenyl-6-methoxyphenol hydroxylase-like FAD-dependent oxidoreductase